MTECAEYEAMLRITKQFSSMKKAQIYQNMLYDKYDYVRLTRSPLFEESGTYVWEVKEGVWCL